MGDQSEMMLDGTLCCVCGVYIGKTDGYPIPCKGCATDEPVSIQTQSTKPKKPMVECRICGKNFKKGQGIRDHLAVVHGKKRRVMKKKPKAAEVVS
jgi:uncharacterized Zn finger protein